MAEPLTFEPEVVRPPTPWQQVQQSRQRALEAYKQLNKAVKGFDFNKFMADFADPLVANYNAEAKRLNLPLANKNWFKILQTADGGALAPKDFFIKYRAVIQPRLFPNDPQAAKAYDLLLNRLKALPQITSGPISGELAHEFGHTLTYQTESAVPTASFNPITQGKKTTVDIAVNEAVASWNGFRNAWKTWERYGIPHKAWGAWFGFPTYVADLDENEMEQVLAKLKKLDATHPNILDQAKKALYEYHKYVEPVSYNIPGADWTAEEKKALQRFLQSRGGTYRETMPEDSDERMKHLKRQPYVMAPTTKPSAIAETLFPISKRAELPLSRRNK